MPKRKIVKHDDLIWSTVNGKTVLKWKGKTFIGKNTEECLAKLAKQIN